METRKLVRNVGFVTRAMLGTRILDRGSVVREVGQARGGEKLEKKREKGLEKESKHGQGGFKGKGKEEAAETRKRSSSVEGNKAKRGSMETKWAVVGQAAKL